MSRYQRMPSKPKKPVVARPDAKLCKPCRAGSHKLTKHDPVLGCMATVGEEPRDYHCQCMEVTR